MLEPNQANSCCNRERGSPGSSRKNAKNPGTKPLTGFIHGAD